MENKENRIIILLSIIILVLVSVIAFMVYRKDAKEENVPVQENNTPSTKEYRSFNCTKEQVKFDTYTIDYLYTLSFKNNEINTGHLDYIYTFTTLEEYQNFEFSNINNNVPTKVNFDEANKTKTYTYSYFAPQKTHGENAIKDYLQFMKEEMGFDCVENNL